MSKVAMKPVVYLITCKATGKQYIGISKCSEVKRFKDHCTSARKGSTLFLHRAIRKYGKEDFTVKAVCYADTWEQAKELERRYILECGTFAPAGFNMTQGGEGTLAYQHTEEAKARMSQKHKGKIISTETRELIGLVHRGKPKSAETRAKMSAWQIGRKRSPETRERMSAALRVAFARPEVKQKMIESNNRRKGEKQRPEVIAARIPFIRAAMTVAGVREKIIASNKRRVYSEATRQKLSDSLKKALAKPETKAKIAANNSARVWTPEARANMSKAKKGIPHSSAHREHMKQAWVLRRLRSQRNVVSVSLVSGD